MKYGTMSYITSDEGILMIKKDKRENDPNSGCFTLPGGKLEPYEKGLYNPEGRLESSMREDKDEAGIKPLNQVLRGTILFDNKDRIFQDWKNHEDFLVYIYYSIWTRKYEGELKKSDEGIPCWVPPKILPSLPKNKGDRLMYEWLMHDNFKKGKNFFGVIKHKDNEIDEEGSWVDWF
jgi:ADP-ribose pyrophosphatase YjhB (NUDIX family)